MDAVEARDAYDDQVDCYDVIQEPREEQNQNAGDERNKGRDMRKGDGHRDLLGWQPMIMTASAAGYNRRWSFFFRGSVLRKPLPRNHHASSPKGPEIRNSPGRFPEFVR